MYKDTFMAIKVNDKISQWFKTYAGVRQGQNDSPSVFSVFLNSLAESIKQANLGITVGEVVISILLYAEDIVLLSDTEEQLQKMLNILNSWFAKWRIKVNHDKTQIIHCRQRKVKQSEYVFKLGEHVLNKVSNYRYLGCTLNEHCDFLVTGNSLAEGASRALGKLLAKFYQNRGLGYDTYTKLYKACVTSIMDYCSGVWGYTQSKELDNIHFRAARCFLGVNKYAPN